MKRFLSQSSIILGSFLIGFGIGMIISQSFQLSIFQYTLLIVGTLVLGGFLAGVSILRKPAKEKLEEIEKAKLKEKEIK